MVDLMLYRLRIGRLGSTPVFLRAILWVVNGLYLGTRLLQNRDVEVNPGPLESPPESLTRRHPEEPLMTWSGGEPGQSAQTIAGLQTPREDATPAPTSQSIDDVPRLGLPTQLEQRGDLDTLETPEVSTR
ncbi:hypothetical protein ACOMHN_023175 [Nucella lapillus]